MRGKLTKRDIFLIGGYSLLLLLFAVVVFFTDPDPSRQSAYFFFWIFAVFPSGPILAGALFGSWRATLTTLIYLIVWIVLGIPFGLAAQQSPLTFSLSHLDIGTPDTLQVLLIFLGLTLTAWVVGFLYERQQLGKWWKSALIILLGSLIIGISFSRGATSSPRIIMNFIVGILLGVCAIPTFILERVIYAITAATMKRGQSKGS